MSVFKDFRLENNLDLIDAGQLIGASGAFWRSVEVGKRDLNEREKRLYKLVFYIYNHHKYLKFIAFKVDRDTMNEFRTKYDINQKQASYLIGCSKAQWGNIESGRHKLTDRMKVLILALFYDYGYLTIGNNNPEPKPDLKPLDIKPIQANNNQDIIDKLNLQDKQIKRLEKEVIALKRIIMKSDPQTALYNYEIEVVYAYIDSLNMPSGPNFKSAKKTLFEAKITELRGRVKSVVKMSRDLDKDAKFDRDDWDQSDFERAYAVIKEFKRQYGLSVQTKIDFGGNHDNSK